MGVLVATSEGSVEDLRFLPRRDEDRDGEVEFVVSTVSLEGSFAVFVPEALGFGEYKGTCEAGTAGSAIILSSPSIDEGSSDFGKLGKSDLFLPRVEGSVLLRGGGCGLDCNCFKVTSMTPTSLIIHHLPSLHYFR